MKKRHNPPWQWRTFASCKGAENYIRQKEVESNITIIILWTVIWGVAFQNSSRLFQSLCFDDATHTLESNGTAPYTVHLHNIEIWNKVRVYELSSFQYRGNEKNPVIIVKDAMECIIVDSLHTYPTCIPLTVDARTVYFHNITMLYTSTKKKSHWQEWRSLGKFKFATVGRVNKPRHITFLGKHWLDDSLQQSYFLSSYPNLLIRVWDWEIFTLNYCSFLIRSMAFLICEILLMTSSSPCVWLGFHPSGSLSSSINCFK